MWSCAENANNFSFDGLQMEIIIDLVFSGMNTGKRMFFIFHDIFVNDFSKYFGIIALNEKCDVVPVGSIQ